MLTNMSFLCCFVLCCIYEKDQWVTNPFSLCYSDDNKKYTFNDYCNNGHKLKYVTCKQTVIIVMKAHAPTITKVLQVGNG